MNDFQVTDSGRMQEFETGAHRDSDDDKPRMSLVPPIPLRRIAWVYTVGASKYGVNNWMQGMPYTRYLDSALRHIGDFQLGDDKEDHLAQACWNLMAIMHHQSHGPTNLNDLPNLRVLP